MNKKTKSQLIEICKQKSIKYENKKKDELISLLNTKKDKGQFYTTNSSYILEGFNIPDDIKCVIEPFAGKGDLIKWIEKNTNKAIYSYDIQPYVSEYKIEKRDTIKNPPDYTDSWIVTNPPFLAKNKTKDKLLFEMYDTDDLYKCFLNSLVKQEPKGGILIIPAGFFLSLDFKCRDNFMKKFKITKVKYFEQNVFNDTSTTIVALSFLNNKNEYLEQYVDWILMPQNIRKTFWMKCKYNWIIGGEIYKLPISPKIVIKRFLGKKLKKDEYKTFLILRAIDTGTDTGKISLSFDENIDYKSYQDSRTYAKIIVSGIVLNENQQIQLCKLFNEFIEKKREETWSLFLPHYREYTRKRIPFELAYKIINYILTKYKI